LKLRAFGLSLLVVVACGGETGDTALTEGDARKNVTTWVYGDSLVSPWEDQSSAARSLEAPAPVAAGTHSIAVTMGPWEALLFAHPGFTFQKHAALVLMVNGGAAADPALRVRAIVNGTSWGEGAALAPTCAGGFIPANAWVSCRIPLSALAAAGAVVTGIAIQEGAGGTLQTVYLDEVAIEGAISAASWTAPPAAAVTVSVAPETGVVGAGGSLTFTAAVSGASDPSVTWSVREGARGGTITAGGFYTAPAVAGTYEVVATSVADPAKAAAAVVTVTAAAAEGHPVEFCQDACPAVSAGVTWDCKKRFMYGTNWGWRTFAGDFGGIAAWGATGVGGARAELAASMREMKAAGVSVIRWWMFPRLLSDGIAFGSDGAPSGVRGTLLADVREALAIAEQEDVYLVLTLFSFDNFRPSTVEGGVKSPGIRPMVVDPARRRNLLQNLVAPVAREVEASPHRTRVIAWDLVNEPEWAMTGPNLYGGDGFTAQSSLEPVTHAEMEGFLREAAATVRGSSGALVTVGGAAIKWASAWTKLGLDFYQLHYYGWVYEWYPYTRVTLASVGLTDRPVVMGEYPGRGLAGVPSKGLPPRTGPELAADLLAYGYAGALSWAYNDPLYPFDGAGIRTFADQRGCEVRY
jgi:hypothetical protein